jgi:hypothetical protein
LNLILFYKIFICKNDVKPAPVVAAATLIFMSVPMVAQADPDNGNNGQCIQVQKIIPPEVQDYEGCHNTFTGPGHNEPPPLP